MFGLFKKKPQEYKGLDFWERWYELVTIEQFLYKGEHHRTILRFKNGVRVRMNQYFGKTGSKMLVFIQYNKTKDEHYLYYNDLEGVDYIEICYPSGVKVLGDDIQWEIVKSELEIAAGHPVILDKKQFRDKVPEPTPEIVEKALNQETIHHSDLLRMGINHEISGDIIPGLNVSDCQGIIIDGVCNICGASYKKEE